MVFSPPGSSSWLERVLLSRGSRLPRPGALAAAGRALWLASSLALPSEAVSHLGQQSCTCALSAVGSLASATSKRQGPLVPTAVLRPTGGRPEVQGWTGFLCVFTRRDWSVCRVLETSTLQHEHFTFGGTAWPSFPVFSILDISRGRDPAEQALPVHLEDPRTCSWDLRHERVPCFSSRQVVPSPSASPGVTRTRLVRDGPTVRNHCRRA